MDINRIIIIALSLLPLIALVIILPSIIKRAKAKKSSAPAPATDSGKELESPAVETAPKAEEKKEDVIFGAKEYSSDDFKGYLEEKSKTITRPERKSVAPTEINPDDYRRFRDLRMKRSQPVNRKNLHDQVSDLSPEILALILSGVFDRKTF